MSYPSDLTDTEWAVIAPLIPSAKLGGRPRRVDMRAIMNLTVVVPSAAIQARAGAPVAPGRPALEDLPQPFPRLAHLSICMLILKDTASINIYAHSPLIGYGLVRLRH